MFGYIVVNKPELKIKDFDTYQAFYCGLCKALHEDFGRFGQVSLNYDLTFLGILLSALYEPHNEIIQERCVIHPVQKHYKVKNEYIAYAAEMTIVLTYLKCVDDWQDDHRYRSVILKNRLKQGYETIKHKYPKKLERIEKALQDISLCEQEKSNDLDKLSSLFGIVMGEIVAYRDDEWGHYLYELGDYLGRYIYIMDAYDDIEEDVKKQAFNPFTAEYQNQGFDERVKTILELMIANSADAFETLPILQYADILRNILYSGVWSKYELIRKKKSGEENARSI